MRRVVPIAVTLIIAGCSSQAAANEFTYTYSNDDLAKMPVAQRCNYVVSVYADTMASPVMADWQKKKFADDMPAIMRRWGCKWSGS